MANINKEAQAAKIKLLAKDIVSKWIGETTEDFAIAMFLDADWLLLHIPEEERCDFYKGLYNFTKELLKVIYADALDEIKANSLSKAYETEKLQ